MLVALSEAVGKRPEPQAVKVAMATKGKPVQLSWNFLRRDWRAGELQLLAAALVVAVAAIASVGFFVDRIKSALNLQARQLLGGDLVIVSTSPLSPEVFKQAASQGLSVVRTLNFPSMALVEIETRLVPAGHVDGVPPAPLGGHQLIGRQPASQQPHTCVESLAFTHIGVTAFVHATHTGQCHQGVGDGLAEAVGAHRREVGHAQAEVDVVGEADAKLVRGERGEKGRRAAGGAADALDRDGLLDLPAGDRARGAVDARRGAAREGERCEGANEREATSVGCDCAHGVTP